MDNNKKKLQVGQSVWIKEIDHRQNADKSIKEHKILTVGKKYFTVDGMYTRDCRFFIETLKHDAGKYTSRYDIYTDLALYEEELETNRLISDIRNKIGAYGGTKLPLETLRQIRAILPE